MSDLSVFERPITENGIQFYMFPTDYPLFKAKKGLEQTNFAPNIPSFFGIKNTDPEYIRAYEEEYGVIFEYATTMPLKLVALDNRETQARLYSDAPPNIRNILDNNYGYRTGKRDSASEKDRELSKYLCSLGFGGYATNQMPTDFGGVFHIELLICNAATSVRFVGKVTEDARAHSILEDAKLKRFGREMELKRKTKKKRMTFDDDDDDNDVRGRFDFGTPPRLKNNNLFGDDDTTPPLGGKRKRRRRRKTRRQKRKSKRRK